MTVPKVNIRSRKMLPRYTDEELTALAARVGLTLAQLKTIQIEAHKVYQEIGADLAEANGGKSMRRADVVEVVLDAGRVEQGIVDPALRRWFQQERFLYSLDRFYEAVAAGFPYPLYE